MHIQKKYLYTLYTKHIIYKHYIIHVIKMNLCIVIHIKYIFRTYRHVVKKRVEEVKLN